ncbi:uncharacterized protein LOC131150725 [Malania oleifera]|uniref:uncharacterized protein LOC131150725 n=1 Tax=Malania oleifera TaxID=397392 RepID=UPI0025AE9875|nr:uncharacterized protein LOC131150725 [Malania oleifera]
MEKRLRSSLESSAEEFLASVTKLGFKSAKCSLKTLISTTNPSSELSSSLSIAVHNFVSRSVQSFRKLLDPKAHGRTLSPPSPPSKRLRRSSRHSKTRVESDAENHESKANQDKQRVLQDLQVLAYIANLCVAHPKNLFSPSDLLPAVQALHNNLILFDSDSVLSSEIANLCEEWWKKELPGRETLISQSLPFLLSRSLTLRKKVDVHRVYTLREAFVLFDFEDESIEDLKLLLIRCLITPLYLKTEDGRRFLAFMFGLSGQLLKEALAMIRSQIPFGRKSMLEAYADIVFRAWKVAEGAVRDEIENGFLQDMIEGAIHSSSDSLAAFIRRVLGGFINKRTTDGVEQLLFRVAEPVIFRSLQVASSNVRLNALHLLLDLFPFEDPDATKEVKDSLLDKQFFLLERLLMDDCPDVRVVAVEGSCRILHLFWEIIPSSSITKMLTKIFDDMSHDICNEVRLSTLNGIIYLLGNPLSHEILKVLLPRLGHLILDSIISIRVAVADLLLLLRDIRSFQFHKVVGLDALLHTLASDQPPVVQKITRLLIPSYFPSKVAIEEACDRCITLIKRSPMAGAKFCEFASSEGASLKSLMELVRVLINLVLSHNKLDADQIKGLLVAASYLCDSLVSEAIYKAALNELFPVGKLKCLLAAAAPADAQSSVLNIVFKISPDDGGGLVDVCMGLVTNCGSLFEDVEKQAKIRSAHKLVLSCGLFDSMFEALTRLLQKTSFGCHVKFGVEIPKQNTPPAKLKKTSKSSLKFSAKWKHYSGKKSSKVAISNFEEDYSIAVGIAWQIKELLISENSRKAMLCSQILGPAFYALKAIVEASIVQCISCDYMDIYPVLAYMALALQITVQSVSMEGADILGAKKNDGLESARSSMEGTVLDQTLDHLLDCTDKLVQASDSVNFGNLHSKLKQDSNKVAHHSKQKHKESQTDDCSPIDGPDGGPISTTQKGIINALKMLTAVLKFIVDAASVGLILHKQEKCFMFTSAYMQYIASAFGQHFLGELQNKEDMEETFLCLKSSFTYAAKFLNLVLTSACEALPPALHAYNLANNLLDLITFIELYLGSGYVARIVAAAKPWLPDIVLALGAAHILKQVPEESACFTATDCSELHLPLWPSVLANIEICELIGASQDEHERAFKSKGFSTFKKFIGRILQLLRGNMNVLDAVGMILLNLLAVGLEKKEFGLVLGLAHFVCVKLVRNELGEWGELNMMLAFLQSIYPKIERETEDLSKDDDERQKLLSSKALLEPVWMSYIYKTGMNPVMEE